MSKLLFVAFPVPEEWSDSFMEYSRGYADNELFKWTTKENLHMTLVFLGAVEEDLIPEIEDALREIASIQQPFTLSLRAVSYGPEGKTPAMIWARFGDDINYGVLAGRALEELSYILGKLDTLKPIPHVTLARFNKDAVKPKQLSELKEFGREGETMNVTSMHLMESKMTQSGSSYHTLATFDFSAALP